MNNEQVLKISVALCTYNGERFIEAQLNSILNQSRLPDEVIVCDDGSTDNTVDIVRGVSLSYPGIVRVYKNNVNLGCVKNFEQAIRRAGGSVIFLSDQDDVWFRDKIKVMCAPFTENRGIGLVYSDALITDMALQHRGSTLFKRRRNLRLNMVRSARQLIKGVGINGCTMAFRSALKEFALPVCRGWGHDHWIAFIAHAVTGVQPISKPLMFYRRHGGNCGIDLTLEDGWLNKWQRILQTSGMAVYTGDRERWGSMYRRLLEISAGDLETAYRFRFLEFLLECERRLEFACQRERFKQDMRIKRLPLLWGLFKGDYHRHLRGIRSFMKDLLLR